MPELHLITYEEFAPVLKRLEAVEKENKILREAFKGTAQRVDTAEALRRTGIKSLDTLKKHFTPTMNGRNYEWSAVEIAEYNSRKELTKYTPLQLAS